MGGTADRVLATLNEMPVPQSVRVHTRRDSPLVDITWSDPNDARIAGWRVWKRSATGEWQHLGSTRVAGYMDLLGTIGGAVQYRVAAYSGNGVESDPSAVADGFISVSRGDALFRDSFEVPAP